MKLIILIYLLLFSFSSIAKSLSCSANGTDVYYINGVLTNQKKNNDDKEAIKTLFNGKENQLDSGPLIAGKPPAKFTGIFNPSFGLVNDAAELFAQAYYAKTGSDQNAKAIFNLVKNVPDELVNVAKAYDPTGFTSAMQMLGFSKTLNLSTLKFIAEESAQTALEKNLASTESLINGKNGSAQVVESIYTHAKESKDAGRKILFVAHSQGNAVLNAGIKKIEQNDSTQVDYMKKYMGAFHVASPVPPLNLYKSRNIRSDHDKVIAAAEIFSRNAIPQEFQISPPRPTHSVTSSTSTDDTGHFFYDTYLSDKVFVRPVGTTATPVKMSDVFTNTLSDLATDLEDNCATPSIQLSSTEINAPVAPSTDWKIKESFDEATFVHFKTKDLNDTDTIKTTRFLVSYLDADLMIASGLSNPVYTPEIEYKEGDSIPVPTINKSINYQSVKVTAITKNGKKASVTFKVVSSFVVLTICNLGNPNDVMNFYLDTGNSFSLSHIVSYDPDTRLYNLICECKIIKAIKGSQIGVHVDATEIDGISPILPFDGSIQVGNYSFTQPFTIGDTTLLPQGQDPVPYSWLVYKGIAYGESCNQTIYK